MLGKLRLRDILQTNWPVLLKNIDKRQELSLVKITKEK